MPSSSSFRPFPSPEDARSAARPADQTPSRERLIPFPTRSTGDTDQRTRQVRRRRSDGREPGRSSPPRRARRRRHSSPWLQRNALSLAALGFLVALLGLGFGVVQVLNRPDPTAAIASLTPTDSAAIMTAASVAPPVSLSMAAVAPAVREIQASAHAIEPTYTVEAGDTLGRIATRYNTTVDRIQAFNNIADARALRIGARLIIPPPL